MSDKYLFKSLTAIILSISIIISCLVFGVQAVTVSAEQLPDMLFTEAPELMCQATYPAEVTSSPESAFAPSLDGEYADGAPVISNCTSSAFGGDAVIVDGEGFADCSVWIYGVLNNGTTAVQGAEIISCDDNTVTARISPEYADGLYLLWVENSYGISRPVRINASRADWVSSNSANSGSKLTVYGENLSLEGETGYIYLIKDNKALTIIPDSSNPYALEFTLPQDLAVGDYELWVHNGHGGNYGWSTPIDLTVVENASVWDSGNTVTVSAATELAVRAAISAAEDYDTVYIPNGVYEISSRIQISNKILRFVGESTDGVIFKSLIDETDSHQAIFFVTCFPTAFKNITFCDDTTVIGAAKFIFADGYGVEGANGVEVTDCKFIRETVACSVESCTGDDIHEATTASGRTPNCVQVSTATNVLIENNYFNAGGSIFVTASKNVLIRNNTAYGNWIIHGGQGPAFCSITSCSNLDISGNGIYGEDYLTDSTGRLTEGDRTFGRAIVVQLPTSSGRNLYIAENTIKSVGHNDDNSGEQIMFEAPTKKYEGAATSATADTVTISNDAGEITSVQGYSAVIVSGKGLGQYRTITAVSNNTLTLEKKWDIIPDTTSRIMIVSPFENTVVYGNEVIGPENYIEEYNATSGIQAYGNMLNFISDGNTFKQLMSGMVITPHYSVDNASTLFDVVERAVIQNNNISDTRYGIFFKFTYAAADNNTSGEEIPAVVCKSAVVRNNVIENTFAPDNSSLSNAEKGIILGGNGITIGSESRSYVNWSPNYIWYGGWIADTLIEGNTIYNSQNCDIKLGYHQDGTILKDNEMYGSIGYDSSEYFTAPPSPIICDFTDEINSWLYGRPQSGCNETLDRLMLSPTQRLINGDFSEGLTYWCDVGYGKTPDSSFAVDDGVLIASSLDSGVGIATVPFTVGDTSDDTVISAVMRIKGDTELLTASIVNGDTVVSSGDLVWLQEPVGSEFGLAYIDTAGCKVLGDNTVLTFAITADSGNTDFEIDSVNITALNSNGSLCDIYTGEVFSAIPESAGTSDVGIVGYSYNAPACEELMNGNFESGLCYWGGYSTAGIAQSGGSLYSDNGNNCLRITYNNATWRKISTAPFTVSQLESGDKIGVSFDYKQLDTGTLSFRVDIYRKLPGGSWQEIKVFNNGAVAAHAMDDGWYSARSGTGSWISITDDYFGSNGEQTEFIIMVSIKDSKTADILFDNFNFLIEKGTSKNGTIGKAGEISELTDCDFSSLNLDFTGGLTAWSPKSSANARLFASDMAELAADGAVRVRATDGLYSSGITTLGFTCDELNADKPIALMFDRKTVTDIGYMRVCLLADGTEVAGGVAVPVRFGQDGWVTYRTQFTTQNATEFSADTVFTIAVINSSLGGYAEATFDNFAIVYRDDGSIDNTYATVLGEPIVYDMGDTNADGKVDLKDLVTAKKYIAQITPTIYKAATDIVPDRVINSMDLVELRNILLN